MNSRSFLNKLEFFFYASERLTARCKIPRAPRDRGSEGREAACNNREGTLLLRSPADLLRPDPWPAARVQRRGRPQAGEFEGHFSTFWSSRSRWPRPSTQCSCLAVPQSEPSESPIWLSLAPPRLPVPSVVQTPFRQWPRRNRFP